MRRLIEMNSFWLIRRRRRTTIYEEEKTYFQTRAERLGCVNLVVLFRTDFPAEVSNANWLELQHYIAQRHDKNKPIRYCWKGILGRG